MLFTLAQVLGQEIAAGAPWVGAGSASPEATLEAGCVLAVIGGETAFAGKEQVATTTELAVSVGLETIRQRAIADRAARHV